MNLGDLLPVFAATDAAAASAERNGKFTEFPDEEPTVKQMNDWLEVNLPVITKSHGELMRGALPPALIQLKAEADADLTDYVPVAIDTTTAKTTMEGQRHNKAAVTTLQKSLLPRAPDSPQRGGRRAPRQAFSPACVYVAQSGRA